MLAEARGLADGSGLVFPSPTGSPLSGKTLSSLCRESDIGCVPHGFRSSFRSWCAEQGVDRQLAEMALGHVVAGVKGAYQRSDLLEARREVMEAWTRHATRAGS